MVKGGINESVQMQTALGLQGGFAAFAAFRPLSEPDRAKRLGACKSPLRASLDAAVFALLREHAELVHGGQKLQVAAQRFSQVLFSA